MHNICTNEPHNQTDNSISVYCHGNKVRGDFILFSGMAKHKMDYIERICHLGRHVKYQAILTSAANGEEPTTFASVWQISLFGTSVLQSGSHALIAEAKRTKFQRSCKIACDHHVLRGCSAVQSTGSKGLPVSAVSSHTPRNTHKTRWSVKTESARNGRVGLKLTLRHMNFLLSVCR